MPTEADRVFREYNRFTGDGLANEPVGAALPIGDPNSGVKPLKKSEIRDWANEFKSLVDVGGNAEEIREAKIQVAADRVQTGLDRTAAQTAAGTAAADAAAAANALIAPNVAAADVARTGAEAARDAALLSRGVFASTALGLSNGVAAVTVTGAGSGGANGVFALAFSGGAGTGAAGTFTVASGAVVSVTITHPGTGYTSAPTVSFAASAGLTGVTATVAIAPRNPVGTYFSVPATGDDSLILYRVDAGPVAVEVARYPATSNVAVSRPMILPFMAPSMVLEGDPAILMQSANRDIVPFTDAYLNGLGISFAQRLDNLAIVEDSHAIITVPSPDTLWRVGNWVAVSVFVQTADWAGLSTARLRAYALNRTGGFSQTVGTLTDYEEIRADLRRYHGVFQITSGTITDADRIWIEVTGVAGRLAAIFATGYMGAFSQGRPGGINWREALRAYRREPRFDTRSIVKSVMVSGDLSNGTEGFFTAPPTVSAVADTILNGWGIANASLLDNTAAMQDTYFRANPERDYRNNNWVAASVLVKATDWDWAADPTNNLSLLVYRKGSGTAQNITMTLIETLASDLRRYGVVAQMTALTTDLDYALIRVRAPAGRTATIRATGYACGFSEARIDGVDWLDFDPFFRNSHESRLTALDGGSGPQPTPDLLIASTYHVLQGRPLELYAAGLSSWREASRYEAAAACLSAGRPALHYASPVLAIDGNRYNGSGFFYARRRGVDDASLWRRAVNFVSSPATKTGSPRVLMIGDSLTAQGTATALNTLLQSAGLTPSFIGTKTDQGGTAAEGRSSFEVATFTNARRAVNVDGSGQIVPIRTGAGSGVTFSVTRSGNVVTAITASGGSGYDDTPALPLVINGGAGIAAYATVAISGGVPGAVTIVNGGSGYTSNPTVTMPLTVSEYLALSQAGNPELGARWPFNPFIRPSTGGDAAGIIKNGYVFDLDFYLSRFSFADPDFVFIGLGTNDVLKRDAATALAQFEEGLPLIYNQVRAALPSARVGIVMTMLATGTGMTPLIKSALATFNGREGENVFVLPVFQTIDYAFSNAVTVTATDAQTGMQTATVSDGIHPQEFGRAQHAEMLHQFVVARS